MSPHTDEKEKVEIEKLIAEINTQESSTLVLSTVASSVSLAILSTLFDKPLNLSQDWAIYGFLFAFLGFIYRELTIHFSEIPNYRVLHRIFPRETSTSFSAFSRMVIVRWFLLLPLAVFFRLIVPCPSIIAIVGALAISLFFSMCELIRRTDC
jgi:amino acid transporter